MPHTKGHIEDKGKKRVPSKPKKKAPMPPDTGMRGKAKARKDYGEDRDMGKRPPTKPFDKGSKPKDKPESKKEEKKTKKTRSERITERADKKWDKDKQLRRKQREASDEGKDKKAKRISERRKRKRDRSIDLDIKSARVKRKEKERAKKKADKQASQDGAGKMPDGFNMRRPAEKLGYIQRLGAGRISPGKMGDMTAMKMMHGDAAAKYYDGGGKHMNGAPKYEGASKGSYSPMKHIDGKTNLGHKDFVSFSVDPDKGAKAEGTITSSRGGSTSSGRSYRDAYKDADKSKYPTYAEFEKAAKDYNKNKKGSTSSRSFSETNTQTPKQLRREGELTRAEIIAKSNMKRHGLENRAIQDSITKHNIKEVQLKKENPSRDPLTLATIKETAGRYGNEAANVIRKSANLPLVKRTSGGYGESRSTTTGEMLHNYGDGGSGVFQVKDSENKKGVAGAVGGKGRTFTGSMSKYNTSPYITKARYERQGTLYEPMPEIKQGGSPKMPKGPMKFGMKAGNVAGDRRRRK